MFVLFIWMKHFENMISFHLIIIQLFTSLIQVNSVVTIDWVVVVSVSEWYDDIFQNWLLWYNRLSLGMATIVIAEDTVTYDKYRNCSHFTTLHFNMDKVSFSSFLSKKYFHNNFVLNFFISEISSIMTSLLISLFLECRFFEFDKNILA